MLWDSCNKMLFIITYLKQIRLRNPKSVGSNKVKRDPLIESLSRSLILTTHLQGVGGGGGVRTCVRAYVRERVCVCDEKSQVSIIHHP